MIIGSVGEVLKRADRPTETAEQEQEAAIVEWLRSTIQPSHKLVAICSGALFAGRAGLLDGRSCTTHHLDCAELAVLAPQAKVLVNRLYVQDGNVYSCAGVTAGIDLMLYLLHQLIGRECTLAVARYLVVYLRRSGSDPQLSPWLEGRNHIHPAIHRVQDAIAEDPTKPWTRTQLAKVAGASGRHLSRLFHVHVGMPIAEYRNLLRVAIARELLGQSQLDMEHIAERAGFESTRQLRRAWGRVYPTSPRHARTGGEA
jgi:transcriptional regulator GlxA family with amidase domain